MSVLLKKYPKPNTQKYCKFIKKKKILINIIY